MVVLVVEDEPRIVDFIKSGLGLGGFEVESASHAEAAIAMVENKTYDAFIIDILLPGMSGKEFCTRLRESGHREPILMLTAMSALDDKVSGLDSGADDYMTKPFEVAELMARLRALIRKTKGYPRALLSAADLTLDPNKRSIQRGDREIILSRKEFTLLEYMVKNQGRVLTRAMIANAVWDNETNLYTNVIDVFVNHIRKKVDATGATKLIHTIRGKGFILTDKPISEDLSELKNEE